MTQAKLSRSSKTSRTLVIHRADLGPIIACAFFGQFTGATQPPKSYMCGHMRAKSATCPVRGLQAHARSPQATGQPLYFLNNCGSESRYRVKFYMIILIIPKSKMENGKKPKHSIKENKINLFLFHQLLIYLSKHKKSISFEVWKGFITSSKTMIQST